MSTNSANGTNRDGPRWHQRLGVRLAVVLAVVLLVYDFGGQYIYDRAADLVGLPSYDDIIDVVPSAEELEEAKAGSESYAETMRDVLLHDWRAGTSEQWRPTEATRAALDAVLQIHDEAFVWLDVEERVVASSNDLPWAVASQWPHPFTSHTEIVIDEDGDRFAHAVYLSLTEGDGPTGTFVMLDLYGAADREAVCCLAAAPTDAAGDEGEAVVMNEDDLAAWEAPEQRIYKVFQVVSVVFAVGMALALALAISRLVTRRLSALSLRASAPVGPNGELPGPFDDRGRDEVAALARAMNAMRSRSEALVQSLSQQDARRREWVAQVSHDLRTPLTALLACLGRADRLLESGESGVPADDMRELLAVARMDADRVQALADDLFEIARLEAGDGLQLEPVPPGELVRQAIRALGPLAETAGVTLDAVVAPALPTLSADGRRLMRAMENLLRNAIQHGRNQVTVHASSCEDGVRFEVHDDGEGLPSETGVVEYGKLSGLRSRTDSAGLGLVVTQKVAEMHGGRVGAHNRPEGGAAVWFTIPAPDSE